MLTPFIASLAGVAFGGTECFSTVAAGLPLRELHEDSQLVRATTRLQLVPIWSIIEFILDGILFLVAGMQLHHILEPLSKTDHHLLWEYGIAISLLVIAVRILWVFATESFLRIIGGASLRCGKPRPGWKRMFIVAWSGMRGAMSLAAALSLSIPLMAGAAATPFPQRDLMIFMTFCVIVSTLILQGVSLPVIRLFHTLIKKGVGSAPKTATMKLKHVAKPRKHL